MLAGVEVIAGDLFRAEAEVAVEDPLDHGQGVGSREDDAGGGHDGPEDVMRDGGGEGSGEDQELGDEDDEHGHADIC